MDNEEEDGLDNDDGQDDEQEDAQDHFGPRGAPDDADPKSSSAAEQIIIHFDVRAIYDSETIVLSGPGC